MIPMPASLQRPWTWLTTNPRGRETVTLLFLTVLALIPRLYRLSSAPAGMNGDEFFNAVDALSLGPGNWQIFLEGNNGREALFLYLMAVPMHLFGKHLWAVRLPAVLLGTGSVLLAYLIGRQAFNRRVGFLAAALMAVSLWPVMQGRLGYRAVSLSFFTALTIYVYSLAIRDNRVWQWVVAGLSLGLTMYTYIPSRVFPLVIIGWFIWIAFTNGDTMRKMWSKFLLSLLIALIVFTPFGIYMLQNPEKVNQRIDSVSGVNSLTKALNGEPLALLETVSYVFFMFILSGDTSIRYHLADRPVFDPLTGVIFYLGTIVTIWLAFKRGAVEKRAAYGLLLLWLGAMLAPSAILGADTSFLRSAGAIVPVYLVAAIGIDIIYSWLSQKWPRRQTLWRTGFTIIVGLGLFLTLLDTWNAYFSLWVNDTEARISYHSDLAKIGQYLEQSQPPENSSLFIAYDYVNDSAPQSFVYYDGGSAAKANWFDHGHSFGWRPGADESWYFATTNKPLNEQSQKILDSVAEVERIDHEDGNPAFNLYRVSQGDLVLEPKYDFRVTFVDGPRLIGFDMPENPFRGEEIPITLHFQVPPGLPELPNRLTYAQILLEDEEGNVWEQVEQLLGYPESGWQAGDRFVQFLSLEIPQGIPPGPIYVRIGLRDWEGIPYSAYDATADRAGPFLLRSRPVEDIDLAADVPVFEDTLALQEARFSSLLAPGLPINVSLEWLALEEPETNYVIWLELSEPGSEKPFLSQKFGMWPDTYPPSDWQKGEQVTTIHRLEIPVDIPTEGDPLLKIRLTPPDSSKSVPLTQGDDTLAEMSLLLREHRYKAPAISHPLEAQFGEDIRLLGYDLDASNSKPDGELYLTLYWQAINTPKEGYTVFNHVVGADGQIQGQFDSPPVSDAWLTSTWLPGEIITDQRTIPIRPNATAGTHDLNIGLYTASDGKRLPVTVMEQPQAYDQLTLTTITIEP